MGPRTTHKWRAVLVSLATGKPKKRVMLLLKFPISTKFIGHKSTIEYPCQQLSLPPPCPWRNRAVPISPDTGHWDQWSLDQSRWLRITKLLGPCDYGHLWTYDLSPVPQWSWSSQEPGNRQHSANASWVCVRWSNSWLCGSAWNQAWPDKGWNSNPWTPHIVSISSGLPNDQSSLS